MTEVATTTVVNLCRMSGWLSFVHPICGALQPQSSYAPPQTLHAPSGEQAVHSAPQTPHSRALLGAPTRLEMTATERH